jgi:hypothetical protein
LLKVETAAAEAARRHWLKVAEVEAWRERFLLGEENALPARPREDDASREEEINRFTRKGWRADDGSRHTADGGQAAPYYFATNSSIKHRTP